MSTDYIKGFNEGYVLTEHAPEVARTLAKVESDAPRMEGFRDGRRQWVLEQTRERSPEPFIQKRGAEPAKDLNIDDRDFER